MQVKINFKQENLNDKEIETVKFLQNQIQQQIDVIPNLKILFINNNKLTFYYKRYIIYIIKILF